MTEHAHLAPVNGHRGPLAGLRLVEMASYISAPYGTMMLADLGMEVIKVEPPRGDPMRKMNRHPAGANPMWINANRGKTTLAVDLKLPGGVDQVRDLLATADVLVCNYRASAMERLGFPDEALVALNPKLIRIYVTGFGIDGPLAGTPAYDSIVQARLGFTDANANGDRPALENSFTVDKTAGVMVAQAAMAAVIGRQLHGVADRVDLAMFDAAAYTHFADVMANRTFVNHSPEVARYMQPRAVRPLQTSDGWLVLVPVTGDQIRDACAAVGREDAFETIMSVQDGFELTVRMYDEIGKALVGNTTAHWMARFKEHDVPAAPCLTLDEHLADETTIRNDLYQINQWPGWDQAGPIRQVRYPAIFSSWGKLHSEGGPPLLPPRK